MAILTHIFLYLATVTVLTDAAGPVGHGRRVVCYMASWGPVLAGLGRFDVENAEKAVPMCTHLVYLFGNLDETDFSVKALDTDRDFTKGGYDRSVALKNINPSLKVMVGIGGWVDGSIKYSNMVKTAGNRAKFVKNVLEFLQTHRLDGLDLNWQFPGDRGGVPADKANLVLLVKELREVFDQKGLVLSVAVSAFPPRMNLGIDIAGLGEHAHFLNILSYEYHQTWDSKVGPSAPLYAPDNFCINDTIHRYLAGAPSYKLNVGLSTYGVDYILSNAAVTGDFVGHITTGHGFKGAFNDVDGFMAYNELCYEMQGGGWTEVWNDVSKTPYARNAARVVSYDNARSFAAKVEFAMDKQLGGVIYYGLEKDDFNGICTGSGGPYPMLRSIHNALLRYSKITYNDIRALCKKHNAQYFWNGMKE